MPSLPDLPFYQDGQAAVTDLLVTNLNTGAAYPYVSDDIGEDAAAQLHQDPDGQGVGMRTDTTFETGSIVFQLDLAADTLPRPGFVLVLRSRHYVITGKVAPSRAKNTVVRVTCPVTRARNPILSGLLSSAGQVKAVAATEAVAITALDMETVNTRAGSTLAYAVDTSEGYVALPSGLTINASTGQITGTPAASSAGTYLVQVVATETLAGRRTARGVGFVQFTITA
jgi:hypothetical protein